MTPPDGAVLRRPALLWALLHVPVILALYSGPIRRALAGTPSGFGAGLLIAYVVEAAFLVLLAYLVALPFNLHGRWYPAAATAATALLTVGLLIDSQLYQALEFHVNGFFFRILAQPGALREIGIDTWEIAIVVAVMWAWIIAELVIGRRFIRRFAAPRAPWGWVLLVVALALGERVAVATMTFFGGPAIFAAGGVLPLQAPLRMNKLLSRLTGRPRMADPLGGAAAVLTAARIPAGVDPATVHFTRRPDIVIALIESLRSDFLDGATMPRLARRAEGGATFSRHYASATSTHYSLFSLFFGLQSQKLDAVLGAGRSPLLFDALKANGYAIRILAASSVDWMGLKQTVFGSVQNDLESEFAGDGSERDEEMLESARRFVERADARPVFLFLFFDGTHFNYYFPERSARLVPYWNGGGSIEAARVAPELLERRARNSAYEVDWKLDEFLAWFEARRGRRPLVIATGDHGEEFREHGRVGHGSDVSEEQIHVPMVLIDSTLGPSRHSQVTSHVDVLPTLLDLLGDAHPPASYSDGVPMLAAPSNRFVLTSVGWEPRFAVIGPDLKVTFSGLEGGFRGAVITDPFDRPLADASARLGIEAVNIIRAFRGEPQSGPQAGPLRGAGPPPGR